MASIRLEFSVDAPADKVWDVVRDVGAVHTRFAPGFAIDCKVEEGARTVTFANGFVAKELIVGVDDGICRLAYAVSGSPRLSHHNASFQVFAEDGRARIIWIADILPDSAEPAIRGMMEQGSVAIRRALRAPGR